MDHPYIFESVQPNRKKNIFYTLPDIIKNDADIRALIDVLDDNNELRLMSIGDISDPSYQNASADDMWEILSKTAIGMKLLRLYPDIKKFRISSALANRRDELIKYDVYANRKFSKRIEVPSFKEYVSNPSKYNPHEVSGGSFRESVVQAKHFLLSEGYTNEQIAYLIKEGKIWDAVKKAGKKAGTYATVGATLLGGSMARGNEVDDIINRAKREVSSSIGDVSSKFNKSQEDTAKQSKIDSSKIDTIDKRIRGELFPLLTKGYEAAGPYIAGLIGNITANGKTTGRIDYDKQLEAIDKVKKVMQNTSGMNQKSEVEKMLKAEYYKW
jgi:hypothetical protein